MRTTRVIGPVTGRTYEAHDTGERWNGAPVLAFTHAEMHALISAGDGTDSNGHGLVFQDGQVLDVTTPNVFEPVPLVTVDVGSDTLLLHLPAGRIWEETHPNSTIAGTARSTDGRCAAGGAHSRVSPAPPPVRQVTLSRPLQEARSRRYLTIALRLADDLIEMDQIEAISLDGWPAAAEFVAHLTGDGAR